MAPSALTRPTHLAPAARDAGERGEARRRDDDGRHARGDARADAGDTACPRRRAASARRAAARVAPTSRGRRRGRRSAARPGCAPRRGGALGRRAQVLAALQDQRRDGRIGRGAAPPTAAAGRPASAGRGRSRRRHDGGVERREGVGASAAIRCAATAPRAASSGVPAVPRQRRLLTDGRVAGAWRSRAGEPRSSSGVDLADQARPAARGRRRAPPGRRRGRRAQPRRRSRRRRAGRRSRPASSLRPVRAPAAS